MITQGIRRAICVTVSMANSPPPIFFGLAPNSGRFRVFELSPNAANALSFDLRMAIALNQLTDPEGYAKDYLPKGTSMAAAPITRPAKLETTIV
jgi:hypothetical protein